MGTITARANIIEFLEREYVVPDAGKLIDFEQWPWQEDILTTIMALDDEGKRQYTAAVVSTPRQQGKSLMLQCFGTFMLVAGGRDLNIFSIACDKDQAALVPERAKKAIRMNPRLEGDIVIKRNELSCPANGNKWTILTSDKASAPGIIADVLLWDELGMLPEHSWDLFYLLLPTTSAREQSLIIIASTVGESEEGPLEDFMRIGRDDTEARTFLYETNEILSPLTNMEQIERDRKLMPPAVFARHYENMITRGASFLDDEDIEAIIQPVPEKGVEPPPFGEYVGNDWGLTQDKCAVVKLGKATSSLFQWIGSKVFQGTKENPVDLNEAADTVREFYTPGRTRKVVFDKWQAVATIQALQSEWGKTRVEGYDFTNTSRKRLFKNLFTIVRDGCFVIYSNILKDCWKRSCGTCRHNQGCKEQNAHEFLRELQGLQCDSDFNVTHGRRGDDITVAASLALLAGAQDISAGPPRRYTGRY